MSDLLQAATTFLTELIPYLPYVSLVSLFSIPISLRSYKIAKRQLLHNLYPAREKLYAELQLIIKFSVICPDVNNPTEMLAKFNELDQRERIFGSDFNLFCDDLKSRLEVLSHYYVMARNNGNPGNRQEIDRSNGKMLEQSRTFPADGAKLKVLFAKYHDFSEP